MKIRHKLLILLLLVSLFPALSIVFLTRYSIRALSVKVARAIENKEFQDTKESISVHVHNYREAINGSNSSLHLALRLQAQEAQQRLAATPLQKTVRDIDSPYGLDPSLSIPAERWVDNHPLSDKINFQEQQVFLPEDTKLKTVQHDLDRLASMTSVYHDLYEANRGTTLWHYTALESGLLTTYPGRNSVQLPKNYDPRIRPWYKLAKESPKGEITGSFSIDATTEKLVLTTAMGLYHSDGTFAGATAIDRVIDDVVGRLRIPAGLQGKASLYLVAMGKPEESIDDELIIFWDNQARYEDSKSPSDWQTEVQLQSLVSSEQAVFSQMIEDIKADKEGFKIMEYNGEKAIWTYSRRIGRKALLIMIVPFHVVQELAGQTQSTLIDENLRQMRVAGLIILAIVVMAGLLSYIWAGKFTRPIDQLADAANTLAGGDFSAQADIHTGDELQRLAEVFNEIGPKLKEHEKTQRSLALARAIQQDLLPHQAPEMDGFQIAGRCRYCDETGGDYFDFIYLPGSDKQKVGIVLGDVTGHGVGAALLMASARSILRNASLHFTGDLAELMTQFNDQLSEDTGDDKFMTLFYGALDTTDRSLTWASGGHDPALWYHKASATFEELPNTGPLTGYMKNMSYEQAGPVTLAAGDILLIGTDGIWETENSDGQPYGKERLHDLVRTHKDQSAEQIVDDVIASVEHFCMPVAPVDDITLIVIKAT